MSRGSGGWALSSATDWASQASPRDDLAQPEQGVFSTRCADRPNPIGLHPVEVVSVDGPRVRVRSLEAVDGTPIVDLKPLLHPTGPLDG